MCLSDSISLTLVHFGQLPWYADKSIVNTVKAYIERINLQVEFIRFRKKNFPLFTFTSPSDGLNEIAPPNANQDSGCHTVA